MEKDIGKKKLQQHPEKEAVTMCILAEELENRGRAKDLVAGRAEGKVEGKAEAVVELLEEYGAVPEWLRERIMQETSLDCFRSWLKLSARVESIEEFIEKSDIMSK